ncbi:unnamed protein product [Polarella glacialis]|uniref:t-SNARE coiled-coil homology domain-containing protein n=1 Tax=Polarella glacialis TaxID=89957 RepID=A0A813FTA4_POLGL|nr:unnamed protein product [Polarella glacialis]
MGALASESLVTDRFAEFQRRAAFRSEGQSKRSLLSVASTFRSSPDTGHAPPAWLLLARGQQPWHGAGKHSSVEASGGRQRDAGPGFMKEFFVDCAEIQTTIARGRQGLRELTASMELGMSATAREQQSAASGRWMALSEDISTEVHTAQRALEALKAKSEEAERRADGESTQAGTASERRIRANIQQALARKHQQLLVDFQKTQLEYKAALQRQEEREMRLLVPDAEEEELRQMMEAGERPSQIVVRKMAGAHGLVLDEVERIQEKHQDIARLERSCRDLAQMFQEVAVLVDASGQMLDNIEEHVRTSKGSTAGAVKELDIASKVQRNTRKWTCCLMVLLMVIALAIMFPILIKK